MAKSTIDGDFLCSLSDSALLRSIYNGMTEWSISQTIPGYDTSFGKLVAET